MRPSIMSDGATMSTPASAWHSAWRGQRDDRLVVRHVAGLVEQAVLAVARVRVERDVGDDAQLREIAPSARARRAAPGPRDPRPRPRRSDFCAAAITGNSAIAGMPSSTQRSASRNKQVDALARDRRAATARLLARRCRRGRTPDRSDRRSIARFRASGGAKNRRGAYGACRRVGKLSGEAHGIAQWPQDVS